MAIAFVKAATGTSTSSSVSWAFGSATTSGNLIVGAIAADDYNGTVDTGWTQSSEMEQQGFHGAYLWWRISTGETSPQAYTLGSATNSAWVLAEFSGVDATPYDTSQGIIVNSSGTTYGTDTITPTSGNRILIAMIGGSLNSDLSAVTVSGWSDSFTSAGTIGSGGTGTNDVLGMAYRILTADGSTGYAPTASFGATSPQSRSGLIISLKEAAGTSLSARLSLLGVG